MIHEIHDLDELLVSAPDQIEPWMKRIQGLLMDAVWSVDDCVQDVSEAMTDGTLSGPVFMLVMESATNIQNAVPAFSSNPDDAAAE